MRIFLLVFSFFNTVLYISAYAFFDYILGLFDTVTVSTGLLSFIKLLFLIIAGFCIGLIVILLAKFDIDRNHFDIRNFVIIGFIPVICLLLSEGTITNFIITKFFGANKQLTEIVYYFFSRQVIWSLWTGFAIGVSVRLIPRKKLKHKYNTSNNKENSSLEQS